MIEPEFEFDGVAEIQKRLERGQSYGLSKVTYGRLAQASISASRMAGIEPCAIRKLDGGEAGAIVTLYGHHSQYEIKVEARIQRINLLLLPLDSSAAPTEIFSGTDDFDCWYRLVNMMLRLEDFKSMTVEEALKCLRQQGVNL